MSLFYRNDPKFLGRQVWENSVDPDQSSKIRVEQSDQGLHCLSFHLHVLDALLYVKTTFFKF